MLKIKIINNLFIYLMDGSDIYCLLCGNPYHSTYNNLSQSPPNSATFYKKESYKIGLNNSI